MKLSDDPSYRRSNRRHARTFVLNGATGESRLRELISTLPPPLPVERTLSFAVAAFLLIFKTRNEITVFIPERVAIISQLVLSLLAFERCSRKIFKTVARRRINAMKRKITSTSGRETRDHSLDNCCSCRAKTIARAHATSNRVAIAPSVYNLSEFEKRARPARGTRAFLSARFTDFIGGATRASTPKLYLYPPEQIL